MGSLNLVLLHGNLGQDPEVRTTPNGISVANFSIATVEKFTNAAGEKKENTEWHRIVAWKKTAELAGKYLKKGSPVMIQGSLQTRSWEDKEGKKMYTTEIKVFKLEFVGGRPEQSEQNNAQSSQQSAFAPESSVPPADDPGDLPF